MNRPDVVVEYTTGSTVDFHARPVPEVEHVLVWHFDVDRPAVALGSRQRADVLDLAACRRAGVEVAHRRSGGGVVLLVPGEIVWVDVLLPATDPRSIADVQGSMVWLGERWVEALVSSGAVVGAADVTVHRGGLERTPWSELVCFAGVGPGEVLMGGAKLVGISQRRTRQGARFQCAIHRRSDAADLLPLLAGPLPPRDDLSPAATLPELDAEVLVDALSTAIDAAPA